MDRVGVAATMADVGDAAGAGPRFGVVARGVDGSSGLGLVGAADLAVADALNVSGVGCGTIATCVGGDEADGCCGWVDPAAAMKAMRVRLTVAMPWAIRRLRGQLARPKYTKPRAAPAARRRLGASPGPTCTGGIGASAAW